MNLSPLLIQRFVDNNGNALIGGLLYSFVAGSSTPQATYPDSTGFVPNSNPVVINSRGEANVWIPPSIGYKFVLTDASGTLIWSEDQVFAPLTSVPTLTQIQVGTALYPVLPAEGATVVNIWQPYGWVTRYGADPTGAAPSTLAFNNAVSAGFGSVYVPAGTYTISGPVNLASNIAMTGVIGESILNLSVPDWGLKIPSGATDIAISGLVFMGTASRVIGTLNAAAQVARIRVYDCLFSNTLTAAAGYASGVFLDGVVDAWIENNRFSMTGLGPQDTAANCEILIYIATGVGNSRLHIANNNCASTGISYHITAFNTSDSVISGNYCAGAVGSGVSNTTGYGISLYESGGLLPVARNVVADNVIKNTGGSAIYGAGSGNTFSNLSITGNVCDSNGLTQSAATLTPAAISVNTAIGLTITGNMISNQTQYGIASIVNSDVVISGNQLNACANGGVFLRSGATRTVVESNELTACSPGITTDNVGTRSQCSFVGNLINATSGGNAGMLFYPMSDSIISQNVIMNSSGHGINLSGGARNVIADNVVKDSSVGAANTNDGIVNAATNTIISGNKSGNTAGTTQRYGLNSSGAYCTIMDNDLTQNQTSGYLLSGAALQIRGNRVAQSATPGATQGTTVAMTAGTVTVTTNEVLSGDLIMLTRQVTGGTPGSLVVGTVTGGTSFVINSSSGTDTSTVGWEIIH